MSLAEPELEDDEEGDDFDGAVGLAPLSSSDMIVKSLSGIVP